MRHEEHLPLMEASLWELTVSGMPNLGLVTGTAPSCKAFAASEASSPSDTPPLPQHTTTLAARGWRWLGRRSGGRNVDIGRGEFVGSATT